MVKGVREATDRPERPCKATRAAWLANASKAKYKDCNRLAHFLSFESE